MKESLDTRIFFYFDSNGLLSTVKLMILIGTNEREGRGEREK